VTNVKIDFSEVSRAFIESFHSIVEARECFEKDAAEILDTIKQSDPRLRDWRFGYENNFDFRVYGECTSSRELIEKLKTAALVPSRSGRIYLFKYLSKPKLCYATLAIGAYPRRNGIYFYWGLSNDDGKLPHSIATPESCSRVVWDEKEHYLSAKPIPLASITGADVAQAIDAVSPFLNKADNKKAKRGG
jgi:hypothetical protein